MKRDVASVVGELARGLSVAATPGNEQLLDGTSESEWNASIQRRILEALSDYEAEKPTVAYSTTKTAYFMGKLGVRAGPYGSSQHSLFRLNTRADGDGSDRDGDDPPFDSQLQLH